MNYSSIRKCDISNGTGVGASIFVQGCDFHCPGCFNMDTWDFNSGEEFSDEVCDYFINEIAIKPHIKHISILGGEPLHDKNVLDVFNLICKIKEKNKYNAKIWLWTGYQINDFIKSSITLIDNNIFDPFESNHSIMIIPKTNDESLDYLRYTIFTLVDYLVDGRFIEDLKDFHLKFRGSSNQRVIDVKKTLKNFVNDFDFSHYNRYNVLVDEINKLSGSNPYDLDTIIDRNIVLFE